METLQEVNYADLTHNSYRQLPFDEYIEQRQPCPIDMVEIRNLLVLYNQFFYITDIRNFNIVYASLNVRKILGYEPEEFTGLEFVYDLIHPDDRELVWEFTKRTIQLSRNYCKDLRTNPYSAVFSIDFRIHCSSGEYIRMNRQTCCFKTDLQGNMIYVLSLFTDINHMKRNNLITYAWKADFELNYNIDDLVKRFQCKVMTSREIEIIRMLSKGLSATEIGKQLFISANTVIKHRKNILHKMGARNTAEMIKYAIEMELI
jgi:PAS domain S-box-containing protein